MQLVQSEVLNHFLVESVTTFPTHALNIFEVAMLPIQTMHTYSFSNPSHFFPIDVASTLWSPQNWGHWGDLTSSLPYLVGSFPPCSSNYITFRSFYLGAFTSSISRALNKKRTTSIRSMHHCHRSPRRYPSWPVPFQRRWTSMSSHQSLWIPSPCKKNEQTLYIVENAWCLFLRVGFGLVKNYMRVWEQELCGRLFVCLREL